MKFWSFLVVAGLGSVSLADVKVTITPATDALSVRIKIDAPSQNFRMPAWAPGDYQIFNYGKAVKEIQFLRGGQSVTGEPGENENHWRIPGGADEVLYTVTPTRGNFSPNLQIRGTEVFVNGPGVFGSFEGTAKQKHFLKTWARAFIALPEEGDEYVAKDYDTFLDSPFVLGGNVKVAAEGLDNKPHSVVAFGNNDNVDPHDFLTVGLAVAKEARKLFGELPYERYIFFLDFGGGGGGLEHLNSCRIGMSSRANPTGAAGIMFHEYFHCFNVKRIRSQPLGPFDYTKPALTKAIWWLEGVTDYYADVLQLRAELTDRPAFLQDMSWTVGACEKGAAYQKVSAEDASLRVWESRGSQGFQGVSYYTKGKAVGLLLDLAIRARTQGKKSLDDVMRALYKETLRGPGFSESRIREMCVQVGGAEMGPLYDAAVSKPSPMPWIEALRGSGLLWDGQGLADDPNADERAKKVAAAFPLSLK